MCLVVKEKWMSICNAMKNLKSGLQFPNIVWNRTDFEETKKSFRWSSSSVAPLLVHPWTKPAFWILAFPAASDCNDSPGNLSKGACEVRSQWKPLFLHISLPNALPSQLPSLVCHISATQRNSLDNTDFTIEHSRQVHIAQVSKEETWDR